MGVVYTDHGRHLESKMAQRLAVQYALETGIAVRWNPNVSKAKTPGEMSWKQRRGFKQGGQGRRRERGGWRGGMTS